MAAAAGQVCSAPRAAHVALGVRGRRRQLLRAVPDEEDFAELQDLGALKIGELLVVDRERVRAARRPLLHRSRQVLVDGRRSAARVRARLVARCRVAATTPAAAA
eukprot:5095038-Prymnesium_polylepis.2